MGIDASSQVSLPELPESTNRKLELRWTDLLEKYDLPGERQQKKTGSRSDTSKLTNRIGVIPSINVAEHRLQTWRIRIGRFGAQVLHTKYLFNGSPQSGAGPQPISKTFGGGDRTQSMLGTRRHVPLRSKKS
jgi:hypothetical protein